MRRYNAKSNPTGVEIRTLSRYDHIVAEHETESRASFDIESQVSDGELMLRIAKADANAFDEIYRRFARPILGLARRRLSDPGKAEDATQETFVSIWRSAISLCGWLRTSKK